MSKHTLELFYKELDDKFWETMRKERESFEKRRGLKPSSDYSASTSETSSSSEFSTASFNLAVNPSVDTET